MKKTDWSFEIGPGALTLIGPAAWIEPFGQAWASWACHTAGWEVHLVQDASLPAPDGPFFAARPRFEDHRCLLEAPGFAGQIVPLQGRALLQAHPAANLADLSYFVRTAFALQAFEQAALLFHAAGVVHRRAAYVFFGHSGSGKTTVARLSRGKRVLNDDLLLLHRAAPGWRVLATPFGRRRGVEISAAPLRALLCLTQALDDRIEQLPRGIALGELIANTPVVNTDPARSQELMNYWEAVMADVPVCRLYFRKADTFWEVIDGQIGG